MEQPTNRLLRVADVAVVLNCPIGTVYTLIESQRLCHYRCPGIRISKEQLADYLEQAKREPSPVDHPRLAGPRLRLKHLKI